MYGDLSRYAYIRSPQEKQAALQHISRVHGRIRQLTPAGKRLLALLHNAFNAHWGASVNRKQIAAMLGRKSGGLTPHDRRLLGQMVDLGLIHCERECLWTLERMPRGAEFQYSMDEDIAWALTQLRRKSRSSQQKAG